MIKKMMIAGLLIWGGSLWAVAQTRMTIAQLFERIEENSKSLRTSKSGVEAASIGIESAKSIGGKTKCVKMNETLNQWKAL